ncbi:MAG TPA: LuxR C-terminal-related transcriptional regulator [Propionibacteriaceae bacterium]|jgi:DNA-binding CsgD family transcriptional regulator|nr:LuxR C-terminal-related transcriptional regulator [Propionibacteriaceae bacterium]
MGVVDDLIRARESYERREWVAAYAALSDLDPAAMKADDFAQLATAAYLLGRNNDCVQALQRAYQLNLDAGETLAAVRCAFWLAMVLITGGETAVGGGWVARSQRLLDDTTGDAVERGYVLVHVMFRHIFSGEFQAAHELAVQITDYGRRFHDPDLVAQGLDAEGRLMLYMGRVREGLALLDEAMVGVAAGEVSPILAGHIYCSMIEACQEISDFGRAAEWTTVLTTWCDAQPGLVPFTGQCAVHRGQIMRVRGAYAEALEEFDQAMQRYLLMGSPPAAGLAMGERGDVLRIQGEFAAAEEAYGKATTFGHEPQPGLALLWLARGRTAASLAAVRRVLAEPRDPVHRSQVLPGAVQVLLACGQTDEAATLAEELTGIADSFGCAALRAMAGYATGGVLLARGDAASALHDLRTAARLWAGLGSTYEMARCRVLIGQAYGLLGDLDSARTELDGARSTFADLGAAPAEHEARRLIRPDAPRGLTTREVEVLRLVASGKSNTDIAKALFLSEKTVSRHLSNIFGKIDVSSRTAAAAFAFEHHLI